MVSASGISPSARMSAHIWSHFLADSTVAKDLPQDELEALALASANAQRALDGAAVRKVIVVPGRLVNIVA